MAHYMADRTPLLSEVRSLSAMDKSPTEVSSNTQTGTEYTFIFVKYNGEASAQSQETVSYDANLAGSSMNDLTS